jgi:hypothetical protein
MSQWLYTKPENICHTAGCIAGTTVVMNSDWCEAHHYRTVDLRTGLPITGYTFDDDDLIEDAEAMLGLGAFYDDHGERITNPLFISTTWWMEASKFLGLPGPSNDDERAGCLGWITAKHAATVLYALADGTITLDDFAYET